MVVVVAFKFSKYQQIKTNNLKRNEKKERKEKSTIEDEGNERDKTYT